MKKLLVTTALVGLATLGAAPAFAEGYGDPCIECIDDAVNIMQIVGGFQKAFNNITDVNDVTDATQTAINAANLVSLDEFDYEDLGEVNQSTFPSLFQMADNDIYGGLFSELYDIQQSATNVVNSFSGPEVNEINQGAFGVQNAFNTIEYGKGGYDATELTDTDGALVPTQAALNAANLVTVEHLTGKATQTSFTPQTAINTMAFAGDGHYVPYWIEVDIWDVGQTATNVANVFSATEIEGLDCGCVSVLQTAGAAQFALNDLSGSGWTTDMSNIVQEATNIANSISYLTPEE